MIHTSTASLVFHHGGNLNWGSFRSFVFNVWLPLGNEVHDLCVFTFFKNPLEQY